jgi:hypothetical protein
VRGGEREGEGGRERGRKRERREGLSSYSPKTLPLSLSTLLSRFGREQGTAQATESRSLMLAGESC